MREHLSARHMLTQLQRIDNDMSLSLRPVRTKSRSARMVERIQADQNQILNAIAEARSCTTVMYNSSAAGTKARRAWCYSDYVVIMKAAGIPEEHWWDNDHLIENFTIYLNLISDPMDRDVKVTPQASTLTAYWHALHRSIIRRLAQFPSFVLTCHAWTSDHIQRLQYWASWRKPGTEQQSHVSFGIQCSWN